MLNGPMGLAVDAYGRLYIADAANNRIRRVDTSGVMSTYVGPYGSGAAVQLPPRISLGTALDVSIASTGFVYLSEMGSTDSTTLVRQVACT